MKSLWKLAALLIGPLVFMQGCATIGTSEPRTSERLVRTLKETRSSSEFTADVHQAQNTVEISASLSCEVVAKPVVERTTTTDSINTTPATDYSIAGLGAAMALTGGIVLADSGNVYPNDDTSRTYNSVGQDSAKVIGWSTLAVGGVLLLVPVVDAIRASGSEQEVQQVTKEGEILKSNVQCPDNPLREARVAVDIDSVEFDAGTTDQKGSVVFDLDAVVGVDAKLDPDGKGKVVVNDKTVGDVSLKALYEKREARAWSGVAVVECKSPTSPASCDGVVKYLRDWPEGKHAPMARQILQEARPAVMRLRDEKAWTDAAPTTCDDKKETIHGVNEACAGVRAYLKDYPEGMHASEAKKLVEKADKRIAKINERLEKEAREEERKQAQAALAAERAAEAAERERNRCPRNCADSTRGYQSRGFAVCQALVCEGEHPACAKGCSQKCGGYDRTQCMAVCHRLECEIGGSACIRGCASRCGGYGNARCVAVCFQTECESE